MGVAPGMAIGVPDCMLDDLADPPNATVRFLERGTGKDGGGKEMFEPGLGIIMATVHVPGLG
jgi:hypothetical protein